MIEKLDLLKMFNERQTEGQWNKAVETTVNLLIDAVNKLETMARNTNTVLESLVQENNIHEKQIDELQMKLEPEKCETPTENTQDKFAEQHKWIGKLCKFWDDDPNDYCFDKLKEITFAGCYIKESGFMYEHCEPVKPDDDIIYKGE